MQYDYYLQTFFTILACYEIYADLFVYIYCIFFFKRNIFEWKSDNISIYINVDQNHMNIQLFIFIYSMKLKK